MGERSKRDREAVVVAQRLNGTALPPADRTAPPSSPQGSTFAQQRAFLRGFLAQPRQVASIVPSSAFLEQRLVRAAGVADARTIVELGPGTGGTTRALLRAARPEARLLAIELSPMFDARLRREITDPRFAVHLGSAEQLEEILRAQRLPAPDVVVSGIPFSTLPARAAERVAAAIARCLAPGGRFVAYQVRGHVADYAAPFLGDPEVSWEWLNVPPVRVYRWLKPTPAGGSATAKASRAAAARHRPGRERRR